MAEEIEDLKALVAERNVALDALSGEREALRVQIVALEAERDAIRKTFEEQEAKGIVHQAEIEEISRVRDEAVASLAQVRTEVGSERAAWATERGEIVLQAASLDAEVRALRATKPGAVSVAISVSSSIPREIPSTCRVGVCVVEK